MEIQNPLYGHFQVFQILSRKRRKPKKWGAPIKDSISIPKNTQRETNEDILLKSDFTLEDSFLTRFLWKYIFSVFSYIWVKQP